MKKQLIYFVLWGICFASCRKIIEIDTNNAKPQMVIEAKITDKMIDQKILISKTVGYTDQSIYPKVSGATVTVTDSRGNNFTFRETAPGEYTNKMRGVSGVSYNLNVIAEGKTFTATSKMPNYVKMDSIGVVINSFFGEERKTAAAFLVDPAGEANYYHFNLYVNNLLSKRVYVENDRLTNGNKLRIQLFFNTNDDENEDLKSGDKIDVEMECIDPNIFDYWFALSEQSGRGPNQGTTLSNPPSNISNNALGYFSANTYQKISATVR